MALSMLVLVLVGFNADDFLKFLSLSLEEDQAYLDECSPPDSLKSHTCKLHFTSGKFLFGFLFEDLGIDASSQSIKA